MTPIYLRIWRKRNKKKLAEISKRAYEKNKPKRLAQQKAWREANKEKIKRQRAQAWKIKSEKIARNYLAKMRYERKNPDRRTQYYQANKAKVLARQKVQRQQKKLGKVPGFDLDSRSNSGYGAPR